MARKYKTYAEYVQWWHREAQRRKQSVPATWFIHSKYQQYVARMRERGYVDPNVPDTDADARIAEYEYTEKLGGIARSRSVYWKHHIDGDPTNNDPSNLITYNKLPEMFDIEEGTAWKDAINMKACILKVVYNETDADRYKNKVGQVNTYSFLAPADYDIEKMPYAVVTANNVRGQINGLGALTNVRIVDKVALIEDTYDGNLKWIVCGVNISEYNERFARENKRKKIIKQLEDMAEKKNTLEKLRKLTEGDEDAAKLFAQLEELDKE